MIDSNYAEIQSLLADRAELNARLALIPYDGTPEVKSISGGKYLYIRKRVASRVTSTYVDVYSDDLYQILLKNSKDAKEIRKQIRKTEKKLAELGYVKSDLENRVLLNLDFARAHMKENIYDQAILEGVSTSFPQTEDIIDNGKVSGMTATDVQKILNLKHAWEFVLDRDVIQSRSDYYLLCHIAKLINEGFFENGGRVRGVPVTIGGCSYIPPLPIESVIKENIEDILNKEQPAVETAIELCLYEMRTQVFIDGNKRTAVIFANHYLISHGEGFLVIPEKHVPDFRQMLVEFYESNDRNEITSFLKEKCWRRFDNVKEMENI